jgi:hypothetical protein
MAVAKLLLTLDRVRPVDRLSIVTLISSLYFFQVWGFLLLDPSQSLFYAPNLLCIALIGVCLIGIAENSLAIVLFINSAFFLVVYILKSPIASNNQILAAFFAATVLVVSSPLLVRNRFQVWRIDREELFFAIAGPGRWLLAIMYFYGIYHKINADFLNLEVSCGVVLYKALAARVGLDELVVGHYAAIWSTFIIEGLAMVLLFSARFKKIGFIIGVPFHIAIGWTGYGYYMDFSTIVFTMYALFLPREAPERAKGAIVRWVGNEERALWRLRSIMYAASALMLVYFAAHGWGALAMRWSLFVPVFTIYALLFYTFVVAFVPWQTRADLAVFDFKPAVSAFVPFLFFLNGASPYLGLKTESSISMFSNLHTEGGKTNHLIHGVLPFGARYQQEVLRVISATDSGFINLFDKRSGSRNFNHDVGFVRYEFDRTLALKPNLRVTFLHNGVEKTNDATWVNTFLNSSWLERRFLLFRPVDFERPKICTH